MEVPAGQGGKGPNQEFKGNEVPPAKHLDKPCLTARLLASMNRAKKSAGWREAPGAHREVEGVHDQKRPTANKWGVLINAWPQMSKLKDHGRLREGIWKRRFDKQKKQRCSK